jgi:sugar phosphate isomerase/epimerase
MATFGLHAVYEPDLFTAIRDAAEHGFHYVQIDLNVPAFYIDELPSDRLHDIKHMAADSEVRLSFHAPGDNVGLFTDFPRIRRGLLDHLKRVLEQANALDAHHLTVHPLDPPSFRRADTLTDDFRRTHHDYFKDILKQNLAELMTMAGDVLLVVENCRFGPAATDALTELIDQRAGVSLALDWAKAHQKDTTMDPLQRRFFTQHKAQIVELHLHDMDGEGRSHLRPGQGVLDFSALFRDYFRPDQWLTVEVRPVGEAARAKEAFLAMMEI